MCANIDIRREAKANGVPLWKIALKLSISEPTMTRRLRQELPPEEKEKVLAAIKSIAKEEYNVQ